MTTLIDKTRITEKSALVIDNHVMRPGLGYGFGIYQFTGFHYSAGGIVVYSSYFDDSPAAYFAECSVPSGAITDYTNNSASGKIFKFAY